MDQLYSIQVYFIKGCINITAGCFFCRKKLNNASSLSHGMCELNFTALLILQDRTKYVAEKQILAAYLVSKANSCLALKSICDAKEKGDKLKKQS